MMRLLCKETGGAPAASGSRSATAGRPSIWRRTEKYGARVRRKVRSNCTFRAAKGSSGTAQPGNTSPLRTEYGGVRSRCPRFGWVLAAVLWVATGAAPAPANAGEVVAVYAAYWAGLPAAEIRLRLRDGDAAYHDEIEISTKGLPHLFTHFRTTASAEGRLAAGRPAEPSSYDAFYDLRQRRDRRVSMRFIPRGGRHPARGGARSRRRASGP